MMILQDVDLFFDGGLLPQDLKRELPRVNLSFIMNFEAINGVTYRSPASKIITTVDLLSIEAVCSFLCIRGIILY